MARKPGDKDKRPPSGLSADDLALWKRFTHDIDPLHEIDWAGLEARADMAREKKKSAAAPPPESILFTPPSPVPAPQAGSPPQLDRRTRQKLSRGQIDIEARIDLHGHTQDSAHDALRAFILRAAEEGKRCVLVITGKGRSTHAQGKWSFNDGVLRARLPEWLSDRALAPHILKYVVAQPRDGGEGAYYVYLRRRRV